MNYNIEYSFFSDQTNEKARKDRKCLARCFMGFLLNLEIYDLWIAHTYTSQPLRINFPGDALIAPIGGSVNDRQLDFAISRQLTRRLNQEEPDSVYNQLGDMWRKTFNLELNKQHRV